MTSLPRPLWTGEARTPRAGWRADVTVFDPKDGRGSGDFERPREYPAGSSTSS